MTEIRYREDADRTDCTDHDPGENQSRDEPDLPLIDTETFYDLLMEQQEQM